MTKYNMRTFIHQYIENIDNLVVSFVTIISDQSQHC